MEESIALLILCNISLLTVRLKAPCVLVRSTAAPKSGRHHGKGASYRETSHEANANLRGLGMWSVYVGIVHLEGGEVVAFEACRQITFLIHNQATGSFVQCAALRWVRAERIILTALLLRALVLAIGNRVGLGDGGSL